MMIEMKKILYPTDFSEYAKNALPYVVEMAKQFNAKVCLVHVIATPQYYPYFSEAAIPTVAVQTEMHGWAEQRLKQIADEIAENEIEVETILADGSAFVEIVAVARREDVDLIIMATHGWGTIKHLLIGGTAEKVVRKAPCPVLTVKHPQHEFVVP